MSRSGPNPGSQHQEHVQLPLDPAEAHVQRILAGRIRANASGQHGEDVQNIRAAYLQRITEEQEITK